MAHENVAAGFGEEFRGRVLGGLDAVFFKVPVVVEVGAKHLVGPEWELVREKGEGDKVKAFHLFFLQLFLLKIKSPPSTQKPKNVSC